MAHGGTAGRHQRTARCYRQGQGGEWWRIAARSAGPNGRAMTAGCSPIHVVRQVLQEAQGQGKTRPMTTDDIIAFALSEAKEALDETQRIMDASRAYGAALTLLLADKPEARGSSTIVRPDMQPCGCDAGCGCVVMVDFNEVVQCEECRTECPQEE